MGAWRHADPAGRVCGRISEGGRTTDGTDPFREGREKRNLPDAYPKTSDLKTGQSQGAAR